jgi:hypothetical protein
MGLFMKDSSLSPPFFLKVTSLCLLGACLFSGSLIFAQAPEPEFAPGRDSAPKRIDLKVEDLPQPIPHALDALQRIGNNVGEEISKATSKAAEVVNKAIREDKSSGSKTEGE